ncbi:MAG: glycoside hydrolase family 3 C-terminal domain-containing protein [Propionibacteriaceae bacterium]|nr:glycoside hydrolase family 3 C-terminal domain-containing protein [Propionibacteriaceae bacterium]
MSNAMTPPRPNPAVTADILARVAALTLQEKVELLTGKTHWRTYSAPGIGLRELVMSDGPTGIRGEEEDPSERSLSLPCPSAVAATWDTGLAEQAASIHAAEARRHQVDVILAPVVNIQRTPVGGRHFEFQSEDPLLSGDMACAVINGIQGEGVGTCIKHFVGNESETMRTQYLSRIAPRPLREVYLAPFERAVKDAHAWSIMASYNRLDDGVEAAPAVAHHRLLTGILKDEWGFDGEVVSDWTATKTTVEPALGGLDLVMPGPAGPWSDGQLLAAVQRGDVDEAFIDDKVARLLLLASRVGGLDGYDAAVPKRLVKPEDEDDVVRHLAARAIVVLSDKTGALPVADPAAIQSVAVIGPNAVDMYIQGGGSALVEPAGVYTTAQAFGVAFPNAVVRVAAGASSRVTPLVADPSIAKDPLTGQPGVHVQALAGDGTVLLEETRADTDIFWRSDLPNDATRVRLATDLRLTEPGTHVVGLGAPGAQRFSVNGDLVFESDDETTAGLVFLRSEHHTPQFHTVAVEGPGVAHLEIEVQHFADDDWSSFVRAVIYHETPQPTPEQQIADAVALAREADLAVVIVGTNSQVESEGFDRGNLDLPGRQNELVAAVLNARPDAVIAVNAGAPVVLPWLERANTVLWTWFSGQEGARSLADVLSGCTEPSGRLPWTLPASYGDVPVPDGLPVGNDLLIDYTEGIHVGYRGWLRAGTQPARPFGFGLGWTTWRYGDPVIGQDGDDVTVQVDVTNTGARAGHETVQVYLEVVGETAVERPVRWLAGFVGVDANPGQTASASVTIRQRAFQTWDDNLKAWVTPPGEYRILVAHDLLDDRKTTTIVR